MSKSTIATYGHGTHNDFVLVFDPEETLSITTAQTAQICNRITGIGADGLIRITRPNNQWFMDYRNADGSIAEMCGNGIRVMARYLVERGHQGEGIFAINTRDGVKHLRVPAVGDITVNMGQIRSEDGEITVSSNGLVWNGYNISMGNPHAVVFVDSLEQVGSLKEEPVVRPKEEYPEGVNVEFVVFGEGRELSMRVFERGVGETQSCGTGTCAVALAATLARAQSLPAQWIINPPGGRLEVEIDAHQNAILTGPAELIGDHDIARFLDA
ncbi:MAG: diaminopimelate epimerase [Actinobacteria bacterium]|uniref:diaminopimelate epimerase n=1 Tax=freshwater metagenome TaxID=449393 RepID=A0A6J6TBE6_9ZZZZ|nr:diaminopimelate epimerase [Actinomycetota bacterium]MSW46940.1 diaminopimelate epimerase [Actinomycetota bacterium]MSX24378.1 diaminopimelate epimerase [Actinomycetota bacterium]MSY47022.1 diaminopimelate epimerase [Actinomycetota bacterium]MSY57016.1 diaminopimelate epimerase [Actinomycetota bacterium]